MFLTYPMQTKISAYYGSVKCASAISKSRLPGLDYTINPFVGCEHGCIYCYVPDVLRKKDFVDSWGDKVYAKENIAEVLSRQIKTLNQGIIGFSTVTDPYQPYEKRACLVRPLIEKMLEKGLKISFQTKSSLILRDIDIIKGENVEVGFTLTSFDKDFSQLFEPRASLPEDRVEAIETFALRNVKTYIFYGPIIPGYNDDDGTISHIMVLAKKTKSRILFDKLNMRPLLSSRMSKVLGKEKVENFRFQEKYEWADMIYSKVKSVGRKLDVLVESAF